MIQTWDGFTGTWICLCVGWVNVTLLYSFLQILERKTFKLNFYIPFCKMILLKNAQFTWSFEACIETWTKIIWNLKVIIYILLLVYILFHKTSTLSRLECFQRQMFLFYNTISINSRIVKSLKKLRFMSSDVQKTSQSANLGRPALARVSPDLMPFDSAKLELDGLMDGIGTLWSALFASSGVLKCSSSIGIGSINSE